MPPSCGPISSSTALQTAGITTQDLYGAWGYDVTTHKPRVYLYQGGVTTIWAANFYQSDYNCYEATTTSGVKPTVASLAVQAFGVCSPATAVALKPPGGGSGVGTYYYTYTCVADISATATVTATPTIAVDRRVRRAR